MTAAPVPRLYLFYGDDPIAIEETLAELTSRIGDDSATAFNAQRLSGASLELAELEQAVAAQPFLASRRLIVIRDADRLPREQAYLERFYTLLQNLPDTCALVMIENQDLGTRRQPKRYQASSPWYAWAEAHPDLAYIRMFARPRGSAFGMWIERRCQHAGGSIDREAAQLLADHVDEDPILADQEIRKLLDYVDRQREITAGDVELLTPIYGQVDIFAMVDAWGLRQQGRAMHLLQQLLQDHDPGYVFAMVVRQFRLLLQAREALELGEHPTDSLGLHPFVAQKVTEQAHNFDLHELEVIYRSLMELDLQVKTGRAELSLSLGSTLSAIVS